MRVQHRNRARFIYKIRERNRKMIICEGIILNRIILILKVSYYKRCLTNSMAFSMMKKIIKIIMLLFSKHPNSKKMRVLMSKKISID